MKVETERYAQFLYLVKLTPAELALTVLNREDSLNLARQVIEAAAWVRDRLDDLLCNEDVTEEDLQRVFEGLLPECADKLRFAIRAHNAALAPEQPGEAKEE